MVIMILDMVLVVSVSRIGYIVCSGVMVLLVVSEVNDIVGVWVLVKFVIVVVISRLCWLS